MKSKRRETSVLSFTGISVEDKSSCNDKKTRKEQEFDFSDQLYPHRYTIPPALLSILSSKTIWNGSGKRLLVLQQLHHGATTIWPFRNFCWCSMNTTFVKRWAFQNVFQEAIVTIPKVWHKEQKAKIVKY